MPDPLRMLLVGCGMMGARHVRGLAELESVAPATIQIAAVCDLHREFAESVADEALELFGERPAVFTDLQAALSGSPDLEAADLVTDPRSHDEIAVTLLDAGLHVICEKPLALTVARGRRMVDAAERNDRVLAAAENNRRDPMLRLARAALRAGVIDEPNFALDLSVSRGDHIIGTAWRHRRAQGGVLLDVAVHRGYALECLMGPVRTVAARAQQVQDARSGSEYDGTYVDVDVDSEDCFTAALGFESGAQGQWTAHFAGTGETMGQRLIVGAEGTMSVPGERSGKPPRVQCGDEVLPPEELVAAVPEWSLNEIEARLFGSERPSGYDRNGSQIDRRLIAAEMHDFAEAVRSGRAPEADGSVGLRSVALVASVLESATAGRVVTVEEVLAGEVHAWQDTLEAVI
ncbi:MAG: hypothetical protein GF393_07390 [Armatimonadia bacterium]|nr:hypothetical protein [Armatimonadia bacterium]